MLYSSGSSTTRPPSAPPAIRRIPDIFSREYNRVATVMPMRRHENIWTLVRPTTVFDVVTGDMITPNALRLRKRSRSVDKVLDPVTCDMITPNALRMRKSRRSEEPARFRASGTEPRGDGTG
jgi:hypothetical protein